MKRVLVLFATRGGHTQRIAQHVAERLRGQGMSAEATNALHPPGPLDCAAYDAAILCASIHAGVHEREVVRFVRHHRSELQGIPSAFLSVSLAGAGAENPSLSTDERALEASEANRMIDAFLANTEWRPDLAIPVAGALCYTKYNWFVRWAVRRMARQNGLSTDTSRDWDYTDWLALDRVVEWMASKVQLNGWRAKKSSLPESAATVPMRQVERLV